MKRKLSLVMALVLVCPFALAQDHAKHNQPPAMDAAMMEAMMKAATPGDAHKSLNAYIGTWNAKVSSWMAPGADPMVMEGVSENKWVMGGRYVEQRFSGNFMGMPFEGVGYTGYDNVKKQYWGTWIDNMSTGMMMTTGKWDGKAWVLTGTMPDPMTGADMAVTNKLIITDADHHTMEMWTPAPDGKTFKMMEIVYSRKK